MTGRDILVLAGIVVVLAVVIGLGSWWQLWMARRFGRWAAKRYRDMEPTARRQLDPRLYRIPGGRNFAERNAPEPPEQPSSNGPQ